MTRKSPLKIICLFGTRPEAIKMAPLILKMREHPDRYQPVVCITGQHKEMLDQVMRIFEIKADHELGVMVTNQQLPELTARVLVSFDQALGEIEPDLVLVQGDTTSAFAGALSAFYRRIPLAHVEAGLRTGDLAHPFPEEANRLLIDRLATYCFAPTELNRSALIAEGIDAERVFVTGNTGIDALLFTRAQVHGRMAASELAVWGSAAKAIADEGTAVVLITLHRRESFGEIIRQIFQALSGIAQEFPNVHFVYPVHLNPNIAEPAKRLLGKLTNFHLIEPLPYKSFVRLMARSSLIVTDSGGIQEEAPSFGKFVIVLRETSERQEALDAGTVTLGTTNPNVFGPMIRAALMEPDRQIRSKDNPYGDGKAAGRILETIWSKMSG